MERLVISIVICSIVMSAISFLFIGLSHILREMWSAKHRFWLWLFILIGFLTPFKPSFGTPLYEIVTNATASATTQDTIHNAVPPQVITNNTVTPEPSTKIRIVTVFLAIWILGMMLLTAWYAYRHYQFRKYAKRFAKPCDKETYTIALDAASDMEIKNLKVITLPGIATPMMTGFRYPTIILPESTYGVAELRLIIRHELTHFKRFDLVSKWLCLICRIVHWFNPFMKIITSHIDQVCELACDEAVILGENLDNRKLYCQSILSTVMAQSKLKSTCQPVIASDFGNAKHELKHRLAMIVSTKNKRSLGAVCVAVAIAVFFSGTVIAVTDVTNNSDITSISMPDKQQPSEDESIFTSTTTTTSSAEYEYEGYYTTSTVRTTKHGYEDHSTTTSLSSNGPTTTVTWPVITTDAPYVTSAPVTMPTETNTTRSGTTNDITNVSGTVETTTTTATVYTP